MRSKKAFRIAILALLLLVFAGLFLIPARSRLRTSRGQEEPPAPAPEKVRLLGIVRDFQLDHPDFQVLAGAELGHHASLADVALGEMGRPVFTGEGHLVIEQGRDAQGRNVAPHLAVLATPEDAPGIVVDDLVNNNNSSMLDSFDSGRGPYGGSNVGADAIVACNSTLPQSFRVYNTSQLRGHVLVGPGGDPATIIDMSPNSVITGTRGILAQAIAMPPVSAPGLAVAGSGTAMFANGVTRIVNDMHVDSLTVDSHGGIEIAAPITIVCEGDCVIRGQGLRILSGCSLDLYVGGRFECSADCNNEPGYPAQLSIHVLGGGPVIAEGVAALVAAHIEAPQATLSVRQKSEVYGTFIGAALDLDNQGMFHVDVGTCGVVEGTPATLDPSTSSGGVTSAETFSHWFRDVPGTNISATLPLTLVLQPDGTWVFDDAEHEPYLGLGGFFPIDHTLFGNEGPGAHNLRFTYALTAKFTYDAAAEQFFKVTSDCDVWVYVDEALAIDLGGMHGVLDQRIDLNDLCLIDGGHYQLALRLAQRSGSQPRLRIDTNILFTGSSVPTITEQYD